MSSYQRVERPTEPLRIHDLRRPCAAAAALDPALAVRGPGIVPGALGAELEALVASGTNKDRGERQQKQGMEVV